MKPARLAVLAIALAAAGVAGLLVMRSGPGPQVVVEKQTAVRTSDVLVAANELSTGQTLKPADLRWAPWPSDYSPAGAIMRDSSPKALEEVTGSIVRQGSLAGEPIRREKLVKADGSGFMSAVLPPGMRAYAISIDTRGATSAGGFILPNDRVDIMRTYRDDEASKAGGGDIQNAETVLSNIRVLAIGQNVQERNGEKVVTGETATLEVAPVQAEIIALAQKTGQLSLVLRSLADAKTETVREERGDSGITIVRYGIGRQTPKR